MKFSTIITSVFFVLFTFTATATFANHSCSFVETELQHIDGDKHVDIIQVIGRNAEVTDSNAFRYPDNYSISIKVMKNLRVVAETTSNNAVVIMDLSSLDAGTYIFVVQTPSGVERKLFKLE